MKNSGNPTPESNGCGLIQIFGRSYKANSMLYDMLSCVTFCEHVSVLNYLNKSLQHSCTNMCYKTYFFGFPWQAPVSIGAMVVCKRSSKFFQFYTVGLILLIALCSSHLFDLKFLFVISSVKKHIIWLYTNFWAFILNLTYILLYDFF